jgi:hypothetical protein
VGTYFSVIDNVRFSVEPCSMLYPFRYETAFASSELFLLPLPQHALRFACHTLRMAEEQPFHVPHE